MFNTTAAIKATKPSSEAELLARCQRIAGLRVAELAQKLRVPLPPHPKRAKGYLGILIEKALGASAQSKAEPDFPELGIELKTIPIRPNLKPAESTFVCTASLMQLGQTQWKHSVVRNKLARVLWVPIQDAASAPLPERIIGKAWLWSPNPKQEQILQEDWSELAGLIGQGRVEEITAHLGQALQIRPKAQNSQSRCTAITDEGIEHSLPRGFYLRTRFTQTLVPGGA